MTAVNGGAGAAFLAFECYRGTPAMVLSLQIQSIHRAAEKNLTRHNICSGCKQKQFLKLERTHVVMKNVF